jgi:hypothetical protein
MHRSALAVFLVVVVVGMCACVHAQNDQPEWNWESVILSRNGPSTTTTPRPTRWTTTTLRSFGIAPLVGRGESSVEEAQISHTGKEKGAYFETAASSSSPPTQWRGLGLAVAAAACVMFFT